MTRNAFVFCIGYSGASAIVDKRLEAQFGKLKTRELFAKGLYKPAFASALFDNDTADLDWIRVEYGKITGREFRDVEALKRAFGVNEANSKILRTTYL